MTPATKFRMASHSKLFTAIAIMQLREEGKLRLDDPVAKYLPWFKARARRRRRRADHDRAAALAQLGPAARGRRPLDVVRVPDGRRAPAPLRRPAGGVRAVGAVEVLQPGLRGRRDGHRAGERGAVGRLRRAQHLPAAGHDRLRAWTRTWRGSPCRTGAACPTERARCCRSSTRAAWRRPPASPRTWRTWRSSSPRSFRRGPRGGAQIVSTGSLREMHRVRSVEENWTSGTGLGFDINRIKDRTYVGHGGGYPGNTTQTLHPARRQGRRHRAHQHERLQPRRHRAAVDGHGRASGREGVGEEAGDGRVGPGVGAVRGTLSRARRRFARRAAQPEARDHHAKRAESWTTRSRSNRSAAGGSASSRPPVAAPLARWCDFVEQPGRPMRMYIGDSWIDRVP